MIEVNNKKISYGHFPDGTLNIKALQVEENSVLISWHYQNEEEFMAVAFLTKYYQANGKTVRLYLPYVPNARMDRVEESLDIFTMKYFGEMINSLNFEAVFVLDVHSSVAIACIKNVWMLNMDSVGRAVESLVGEKEGTTPIMFYPDEGAMKRYSKQSNLPYAYGMKKRDWKTGNILGLEVCGISTEELKGKPIIIRDDICSKGGTFYHSARKLKELGCGNIYLYVTHCETNIHKGKFGENNVPLLETGLVEEVYTTNSIYPFPTDDIIHVIDLNLRNKEEE